MDIQGNMVVRVNLIFVSVLLIRFASNRVSSPTTNARKKRNIPKKSVFLTAALADLSVPFFTVL